MKKKKNYISEAEIVYNIMDNIINETTKVGLSLSELSRRMGKNENFLGVVKSKGSVPSLRTLITISRVLNIDVSKLLKGVDYEEK